jgi:Tfp pilus assembly protein PilF
MSLLMDALKKAEQDKKKAAGSNDVTQPGAAHGGDKTRTDTIPGQKTHPADTTQTISDTSASADATQVLPQSPLVPGDETQAISAADSDEFDDFLDDSSEALSLEPLPEEIDEFAEGTPRSDDQVDDAAGAEATQVLDQEAAPTAPDQTTQVMKQPAASQPGLDQTTAKMTRSRGDETSSEMPTVESRRTPDSTPPPVFQELSLVDEDVTDPGASGGESFSPLETDATLPSARVVESDLKDYFDASQSIEVSKLDLSSATQGIPTYTRPMAPGEATQVTAQTIFTAGRSPSSSRLFKWSVAIVFVLAVALGAAGFYYYYQSPTVRQAPSPMVARGVESTPPPAQTEGVIPIVDEPVMAEGPEPLIGPAGTFAEGEPEAPGVADAESFDEQADAALASVLAKEPEPVAETSADAERVGVQMAASTEPGQSSSRTAVPNTGSQQPPPSPAAMAGTPNTQAALMNSDGLMVQPGAIKISRAKPQSNRNSIMLSNAYDAYQQGDAVTAKKLYEATLARDHDNRDAHLGLAAIAMKSGDRQTAFDHYVAVLRNNPKDSVANAAVFAMQRGPSPLVNEARLKILLDQNPQADHLHFALGNVYARQQRWPEAQQAFFNAYTSNSANPIYALNLAISLDRMGQQKTALGYYKEALATAPKGSAAGFDRSKVLARVQKLEKPPYAP